MRSQLEGLLRAFEPYDALEASYRDEMLQLVQSEGCTGRNHFVPGHFTASSFVLPPEGDELLLIFHGKLHRWLQPGGHIDPEDTTVFAAARREVAEEVGLTELTALGGLFDVDVHAIPPLKGDPGHKHFDLRFLFRATTRDVTAGSDAKDARWVSLADINAVESDESVMRAVKKLLHGELPERGS